MSHGSCLCGAVQFDVTGPYQWFSHCHCSMCRKHHGAFHSTALAAQKTNFRFTQGEDSIVHYRSSPAFERPFCKHCGSKVPDASGDVVSIPAGMLDEVDAVPRAHIFVADKSPMETITDSLKRFDRYPEGFGTAMPAPTSSPVTSAQSHGGCLGGDVAFEIDATPTKIVQCHCSRCRRSRGTAHGVNTFVARASLRITRGADRIAEYKVPDARVYATAFCSRCGSLLPVLIPPLDVFLVPVGSLDTPFAVQGTTNIYVDSKPSWFTITNQHPQFAEMPPRERFGEIFF